jgi:uncharacterized membrane protein YqiK
VADDLERAVAEYRRAQDAIERAKAEAERIVTDARAEAERKRLALNDAIVAAARAGTRQKDIAAVTGFGREWIRRICRAAGIEPDE